MSKDRDNAIITICVGEDCTKIGQLTHPLMERYAEKIGADFLKITESFCSTPHWDKFALIHRYLNKYKRILYLDSDLIIRQDCPSLFEQVPEHKLGMFNEAPFTDGRAYALTKASEDYKISLRNWNGKYFNTGVMVISRPHKYLFVKPEKEISCFYEQSYLNLIFAKENVPVYELPYNFNRMTCMDKFTGEDRHASYIIHYAGYHYINNSLNFLLDLIPKDLEKWEKGHPNYNYQRHILLDVQGGLGDQIDAEPAIRYLKKYVYPKDDVRVKTHFPRVFEHLDIPVTLHEDFRPAMDTPYYHVITLPGPETVTWSIVSNLLCHTVDYTSMAILRRTLPNTDKIIKLVVNPEDYLKVLEVTGLRNLNDLVLLHCGRHWESKCFPTEWWQAIVDGLSKEVPLCLIGSDTEPTRGTAQVVVPEGVIDTRNLLDLGGFFAIVKSAKVLVTNDSSPVHVAGAFGNEIILIPSCKHPDHILPFRKDPETGVISNQYKAIALYKRLTLDDCESAPTCIHGSSAEFIKKSWDEYLPEPKEVIQEAIKRYRKK